MGFLASVDDVTSDQLTASCLPIHQWPQSPLSLTSPASLIHLLYNWPDTLPSITTITSLNLTKVIYCLSYRGLSFSPHLSLFLLLLFSLTKLSSILPIPLTSSILLWLQISVLSTNSSNKSSLIVIRFSHYWPLGCQPLRPPIASVFQISFNVTNIPEITGATQHSICLTHVYCLFGSAVN